jgi:hypothetical protein
MFRKRLPERMLETSSDILSNEGFIKGLDYSQAISLLISHAIFPAQAFGRFAKRTTSGI